MTEERCRRRLEVLHDAIYWIVSNADERARVALQEMNLQRPDPSFRAFLRQQMMVDNARGYAWPEKEDVALIDRAPRRRNSVPDDIVSERFVIRIGKPCPDAMICGLKKFDADFRTSNYQTPTAVRYVRQLPLDNIPGGFRFFAGYQVDETDTMLTSVAVVCPGRILPNWWYELEPADQGGAVGTTSPLEPARVRVKKPQLDLPGANPKVI
jgi:hypothetical protein